MNFEQLINQTYLTKAEYNFCVEQDSTFANDVSYIGDYSSYGDYLNLRAYSEHDHEKWETLEF